MRILISLAALIALPASAQTIDRRGLPQSPISTSVAVPAGTDLVYVSGTVPAPLANGATPPVYGDTRTQTLSVLKRLEAALREHGLELADVVMMRIYLVGDPATGGRMDFDGMMAAYREFFGTDVQPRKPARSTMQVAGLLNPAWLVEIDAVAARP